jgi:LysR family glycine cleavage system transcriptional activator
MISNLSALYTFVQVSKHLNFTKAARDLNLTQGAVSIQIKQLEEELGFRLFHRDFRKISLTGEGKELLQVVEPALNHIMTKIESLKSRGLDETLTVSTLPSFAAKWLIPRLLQFQRLYPEIDLRVHTSEQPVDFIIEKVDCAVRYGWGDYPELFVEHIIDEVYFPVYSPDLLQPGKPLQKPEDVHNYPLLHDDYANHTSAFTWKEWAKAMKVSNLDFSRGFQFGQSDYVIQAAIAGQGIALTRISLAADDLKSGLLVPLDKSSVVSDLSYYFVCPPEYRSLPKVKAFREWIMEKMQKEAKDSEKYLSV